MSKPQDSWEVQLRRITGASIQQLRKERKASVDEIARQLGDTGDSLRKKEAGIRRFSVAEVVRLADLWSVSTDRIIYGTAPKPKFLPVLQMSTVSSGNSPLSETPRPQGRRTRH